MYNNLKNCKLCDSNDLKKKNDLIECMECGHIVNSKWNKENNVISESTLELKFIKEITNNLKNYYGSNIGNLLCIGRVDNRLVNTLQGEGFIVTFIDSINILDHEKNQQDANDSLITKIYDLCMVIDDFEYQEEPIKWFNHVEKYLKMDGVLYLVNSSSNKLNHLHHFNNETVQNVLNKCGFRNLWVTNHRNKEQVSVICRRKELNKEKILSIIIPVYNEKNTVHELLTRVLNKKLPNVTKEVIVVESNSTDGTRDIVKQFINHPEIRIIYEEKPRGKGHGVRTGLSHANGEFVIIQDGDLEYDINDYDNLIKPLIEYKKAFVLGSRHIEGDWKMRKFDDQKFTASIMNFGQVFFTGLLNLACGSKLKDPFTMYKVFRMDCIYGLKFESNRFDFDWEIVIKLLRKGYTPLEIPINYTSRSFKEGKKVSMLKDPILWVKALIKFRYFVEIYSADKFNGLKEGNTLSRKVPSNLDV